MVRRGQSTHICNPFEKSYFVTNWTAAWKGLDFSPALKEQKMGDAGTDLKLFVLGESHVLGGPQKCKWISPCLHASDKANKYGFRKVSSTVLCKTEEGYWATFSVPRKTSKLIHEYLKQDPMLEKF